MNMNLLNNFNQSLRQYYSDAQNYSNQLHGIAESLAPINPQATDLYTKAASVLVQSAYSAENLSVNINRISNLDSTATELAPELHSIVKHLNDFNHEFESVFNTMSHVQNDLNSVGANYEQVWRPIQETLGQQKFQITEMSVDIKKQINSYLLQKNYDPNKITGDMLPNNLPTVLNINTPEINKSKVFKKTSSKLRNTTKKNTKIALPLTHLKDLQND